MPASLAQDFLALPWTVVALAILGLVLTYLLRGWRVYREFKQFPKMRFGAALQVVLWHNASVNVMPFRTGEAAFPWLLYRRFDISLTRATASLLWLRIQDACVVLMLGIWVLADIELLVRVLLSIGLVVAAFLFAKWSRTASSTSFTQWPWKYLNGFRQALAESNAHSPEGWWITLANWLIKLTDNHRSWGFGLCYLYLRNVKGFKWNHKRVYRIYKELELNLRIKPRKRLVREKPEALTVPLAINQVWSMDFMHDPSHAGGFGSLDSRNQVQKQSIACT